METFEKVVYEALYEVMELAWEKTEADLRTEHPADEA